MSSYKYPVGVRGQGQGCEPQGLRRFRRTRRWHRRPHPRLRNVVDQEERPPRQDRSTSQEVEVQVLEVDPVDERHLARPQADHAQSVGSVRRGRSVRPGTNVEGEVDDKPEFGLFLGLDGNVDGMVHLQPQQLALFFFFFFFFLFFYFFFYFFFFFFFFRKKKIFFFFFVRSVSLCLCGQSRFRLPTAIAARARVCGLVAAARALRLPRGGASSSGSSSEIWSLSLPLKLLIPLTPPLPIVHCDPLPERLSNSLMLAPVCDPLPEPITVLHGPLRHIPRPGIRRDLTSQQLRRTATLSTMGFHGIISGKFTVRKRATTSPSVAGHAYSPKKQEDVVLYVASSLRGMWRLVLGSKTCCVTPVYSPS